VHWILSEKLTEVSISVVATGSPTDRGTRTQLFTFRAFDGARILTRDNQGISKGVNTTESKRHGGIIATERPAQQKAPHEGDNNDERAFTQHLQAVFVAAVGKQGVGYRSDGISGGYDTK
jgi:hypothetical protein